MKITVLPQTILFSGCVIFSALCGQSNVAAQSTPDEWEMTATAQAVVGSYSGSDLRDSFFAAGFFFGGDYLEKGGFAVGYNHTEVDGKGASPGDFDTLKEDTFYLSGKILSYPDSLPGKLTWRLDAYFIQNEAEGKGLAGQGDADIGVANPVISYINHDKTRAFDLGYAYSNYDYDGLDGYQAHQLTPTMGFAFGGQSNWVQLRGYFIHLSDDDVNDGNNDTVALEVKWTHWFGPDAFLRLHSAGLNVLVGERFLAVDADTAVVFTLADEQQGSIALNGVWKPGEQTSLMLQAGYDQYENRALNNDYDGSYIYLNLSQQW